MSSVLEELWRDREQPMQSKATSSADIILFRQVGFELWSYQEQQCSERLDWAGKFLITILFAYYQIAFRSMQATGSFSLVNSS